MRRIGQIVDQALAAVAAVVLIAMMLHTVANAVSRRFFSLPLDGTNELVAYWYLPVIALAGFVATHWRREHIRVSLVVDRLPLRNQIEYLVLNRVLGLLVCLGLAWYGLLKALENLEVGLTAGVSSIVVWPVSFVVPVVFVLLGALFVADIVQAVRGRQPRPEENHLVADAPAS